MKRKWRIVAAGAGLAVLLLLAVKGGRQGAGSPGADGASATGKLSPRSDEGAARRRPLNHEGNMRLAREWYEKLTAERPELQIQYRDIPDERNGLVQLMKLLEEAHLLDGGAPMEADEKIFPHAKEMGEMLRGDRKWDPALAAEALRGKEDLLKRLEEIGQMTEQSRRGVDMVPLYHHEPNLGAAADLMVAKSRLAAEAGDGEEARRTLQALGGVAEHLRRSEAPTLLDTVMGQTLRGRIFDEESRAMDAAKTPEEVAQWHGALPTGEPLDMAATMRAEWNYLGPESILPMLLGEETQGGVLAPVPDPRPEATAAVWADLYAQEVRDAPEMDAAGLLAEEDGKVSPEMTRLMSGVTPGSRAEMEMVSSGFAKIMRGLVLARSHEGLLQAAAAVAAGEDPGVEPVTGQPYRVDREAGTVALPDVKGFGEVEWLEARKIPGWKKAAP